ncbi:hypothetical protein JCM8547_003453 [Rhodosporidiobolus lusitaniae]
MRLTRLLPALAGLLASTASLAATAQEPAPQHAFLAPGALEGGESFTYQSDIARLMRVVVSHLYNDRDVFVRELLSNANDALEKVRLTALTDPKVLEPAPQLNVSVLADADNRRIVIRDSGIGMSKEQLAANLGTIARSGTSEFLESLEKDSSGQNLIGQFGLGFYSSFLVADRVTVASQVAGADEQYIFEAEADSEGFKIVKDPRGATLGRGTEITLFLKPDAGEYLDLAKLKGLITKHAEYNAAPIYLYSSTTLSPAPEAPVEEEGEVKVEDGDEEVKPDVAAPTWELINDRPPLWMRDPKDVSKEEYDDFYMKTFKAAEPPLAYSHFKGDAGSTTFRALIYIPSGVPNDFYSKSYQELESLKLFVRRVFITSDLGKDWIERHLSWVKIFVDADDLPLNVGRDNLQKNKALSQIRRNVIKRIYDTFGQIAKNSPADYNDLYEKAGIALKVGAVEDSKNRDRIIKLLRFETSVTPAGNLTSLDEIVARRKEGQTQIFFISGAGQKKEQLEKSPFVERILARGYEVLYFSDPIDEMLVNAVPTYSGLRFQDVAKDGVKFGDEDENPEDDEEELKATFAPLVAYLKKELAQSVEKVTLSTRLTTSPCIVTAGTYGYSGNMERLLAAQNAGTGGENFMLQFAKSQKKNFELNPKHPLIERLLEKVEEAEGDEDATAELNETVEVLWQTALLKSSYQVPDPNAYFAQIETILRRALGVSQSAQAEVDVKPAPPVDTSPPPLEPPPPPPRFDEEAAKQNEQLEKGEFDGEDKSAQWVDWAKVKDSIKDGVVDFAEAALPDFDTENPIVDARDVKDATKEKLKGFEPVAHEEL